MIFKNQSIVNFECCVSLRCTAKLFGYMYIYTYMYPLSVETAKAPHSSTLAWKIPWMEEHGRLQSMGCKESDMTKRLLSPFTFMHWRRSWQPTPVFLPGKSHGQRSLVGCSPWVAKSRTWLKRLSSSSSRLQRYMKWEPPDVQTGFRKGRGTKDQIANICWIIEKAREFQKSIYFYFISLEEGKATHSTILA